METIVYEKIDQNLGILKINKPKFLNSLSMQTLKEMDTAISEIEKDEDLHVLIITGEGTKAFVAGADIKEMKDMDEAAAASFSEFGNMVFEKIENLDKVVIGAINGYCLGGGLELALCCDIRIGSENSKFSQPEVGLGIIPGFGGTQRLFNVVGIGKAKELIFTGDIIDAQSALSVGLLNNISNDTMQEAIVMARKIIDKSHLAVAEAKKSINYSYNKILNFDYEVKCFARCFTTEDQKEGMSAFVEKRKANFKNK